MRKLSITLLLIGISFMTMEANNYSTDHKTRIYFKKWNERQKTVIFLPIEATIEENNIEVQFFEKSNEPATFQVKDKNGNIVFQDVVIPDKLEIYKIDLDGFKADKLPFIPYHRESRRIHGLVRFNLNHALNPYTQDEKLYRTCIAVGDYPVDHHHTRYHGYEELPNLYFHPIPSYGLPLGTLIPQEVDGLIVAEKSISVSNIMNGTTRLQPVVLQIGQAAGALAALAVKNNQKISDVSVRDVQNAILDAKGYLLPYLDVPVSDVKFASYQRIGSTGILKGVGKNVDWSNQTWLRADTVLLASELDGLFEVYPAAKDEFKKTGADKLSIEEAVQLVQKIAETEKLHTTVDPQALWKAYGMQEPDLKRNILRGEMAVMIDQVLDPFNKKQIDITGKYIQ